MNIKENTIVVFNRIFNFTKEKFDFAKNKIKSVFYDDSYQELVDFKTNKINEKNLSQYAIYINSIYFKYNKKQKEYTLKNCSLKVKKGSFHAFVGENGAGKSTMINIICGLLKKYYGDVYINSKNFKTNKNARFPLTYISAHSYFPNEFTVYEYLLNMVSLVRNDFINIKEEIEYYLEKFEITDLRDRFPNKLSSGQKQKIMLIKSIVEKSEIFILDEPTSNLDPTSRLFFYKLLDDLRKKDNITIFISSHSLDEITRYVTEATIIKKGNIYFNGKVNENELIEKYKEIFLKDISLFGDENE